MIIIQQDNDGGDLPRNLQQHSDEDIEMEEQDIDEDVDGGNEF